MHVVQNIRSSVKKFWAKTFLKKNDFLVAICDKKLLGKIIKTDDLEIKIKKEFYGGYLIDENEALKLLKKCTIANLMGKEIVKLALENGFITEENVLILGEIPHAQMVKLL